MEASLPGMTRRAPGPADSVKPLLGLSLPPQFERKILLIATASISDSNIFNNGLYQNCFVIYRLAEAIGWLPIFVVNEKPTDLKGVPEILHGCRLATVEDILRQPIAVGLYLEIGMSMSADLRRYMKLLGARSAKLYLGNILNIDIETPMCFPGMHFAHHVVGEQDEIWTSPHYAQHAEYAALLNHVPLGPKSLRIAPYVWDPAILTDDGRRNVRWRPARADERPVVVIMEPNISFQKTGVIPLLLCEEYARANKDTDFEVVLMNSDRLAMTETYKQTVEPSLTLVKEGRVRFAGRQDILTVLREFPWATFVCHHWNNEFNYMVLELMWAGVPVLHNAECWKEFAYYYPSNDTVEGARRLGEALWSHDQNVETYKSHARCVAWRHSPYNPDVQKAWKALLEDTA